MTDAMHAVEVDDRPSKRVKLSDTAHYAAVHEANDASPQYSDNALRTGSHVDEVRKKERDVGITAYVSSEQAPLRGLLKKRYTDFLVNEITPEGQVLHLKSIRGSKTEYRDVKNHESLAANAPKASINGSSESVNGADTTAAQESESLAQPQDISTSDRAKLSEYFSEEVVRQVLILYNSIVSNPKAKPSDHPVVRTPFTTDRSLRGQIHQEIRRIFSSCVESQTDHSGTLILSAAQPSRPNNDKPSRNKHGKLSWAERGGEYLHFSLYKENKDSIEMVNLLARLMKMNPKEFRIAGTKDRRAATVQRVSVYRVVSDRLVGLNKTLRGAAVGDFAYKERGLELGELSGNEFEIVLRECEVDGALDLEQLKDALRASMNALHQKGFLNYYGLQRFGTFGIRTDEIGAKILKGDFEGACNMLLDFNPSILEVDLDEAENTVGRDDKLRAEAIDVWRKTGRINAAVEKMPKRFSAETNLIRHLGKNQSDFLGALLAIPRTQRTLYVHAYQSRIWNMAASERCKLFGDKVVEGDLVLVNEHKDKQATKQASDTVDADGEVVIHAAAEDSSRTGDDIFERARHLTAAEAASGLYSSFDLVLPTPGWDIEYPKNLSGDFYKTFMATEEGGDLDPRDMRRKQRDFSLSGSYRKVMARIEKDFDVDVKRYDGEDETLLQTDLDKSRHSSVQEAGRDEPNKSEAAKVDGQRLAVVLKFQLRSSQYATMALRELSRSGIREYKPDFSGGR